MRFRAILFDLGNVLVFHNNELLYRNLADAFFVSDSTIKITFSTAFWDSLNRGEFPGDTLREHLCTMFGRVVSPSAWLQLWNSHFTVNQPMVDYVASLHRTVRLGLLSNTHHQHFAYLQQQLPVLKTFEAITLSYQVRAVKPEAAIYRAALSALGAEPLETLFVDDIESYTRAAQQLGIHGVTFTSVDQVRSFIDAS